MGLIGVETDWLETLPVRRPMVVWVHGLATSPNKGCFIFFIHNGPSATGSTETRSVHISLQLQMRTTPVSESKVGRRPRQRQRRPDFQACI